MSERQSRRGARDAGNGQFIPMKEADRRPGTTVKENIPLPGHGTTGRGHQPSPKKR